jgi:hypothetical protein
VQDMVDAPFDRHASLHLANVSECTVKETDSIKRDRGASLWASVAAAAILLVLDAFILNGFLFGVAAVFVLVVWLIPRTLFAFRRREVFVVRGIRALIYLAAAACIIAAWMANDHHARSEAARLVNAIQVFHGQHDRYPASLNELVPKYVPMVPRAKYTLLADQFIYRVNDTEAQLTYVEYPPFRRKTYDFATRKWFSLD